MGYKGNLDVKNISDFRLMNIRNMSDIRVIRVAGNLGLLGLLAY
jgi:hypothetical protein